MKDNYSVEIKLEPTDEEYAGQYIDLMFYGAENGDGAFAIDLNFDGAKAGADAWFTESGITLSSEDFGVNATVTKEYTEKLVDMLIGRFILGGADEENMIPDLSDVKTKLDDLSKRLEKTFEEIVTGEEGFKAEKAEIEVEGKKVPAVKLTYSLDKYAVDKLIGDLLDDYSGDIDGFIDFLAQFAGGSASEYYDDETGEWVTETYELEIPSASEIKKYVSAIISQMDTIDFSFDIIVNDETDCIDSVEIGAAVKIEEVFDLNAKVTVTNFANAAGPRVEVELNADDGVEPTTIKAVSENTIKDGVYTMFTYADATVDGETKRCYESTFAYNLKTKAYKVEIKDGVWTAVNKVTNEVARPVEPTGDGVSLYADENMNTVGVQEMEFSLETVSVMEGTLDITDTSIKMTIDKWLMDEEPAEAKILIEIKSGVTMPAVPADAAKIDSDDALESYISGLDMEKIQGVLEGFGFGGAQKYPEYDDEYYDDYYDESWDDEDYYGDEAPIMSDENEEN
jgi:hypothetical protein